MVYVLITEGGVQYATIYRDDMARMVHQYWAWGYLSRNMKVLHLTT